MEFTPVRAADHSSLRGRETVGQEELYGGPGWGWAPQADRT